MAQGATGREDLGPLCGEVGTIAEVVATLTAIRDASASDIVRPAVDGISAFSRLYTTITQNVLDTVEGRKPGRRFQDPAFLTRLDIEFARRYLAAIRADATGGDTPRVWDALFSRRRTEGIRHINFAAAGVNAHVNFDLTFALLETWREFPPNRARHADYNEVNAIFAEEMDDLREGVDAFLSEIDKDGSAPDRLGNWLSNVLVRWTRAVAWWTARLVWRHYGKPSYDRAYARMHRRLDRASAVIGVAVLKAPRLP